MRKATPPIFKIVFLVFLIPFLILFISEAYAFNHRMGGGMRGGGMGGGGGMRGGGDSRSGFSWETAAAIGLEETGLDVKFPEEISCEGIASEYASPYRYDGSDRPSFRMAGLHGGMDLSLDIGTPLLAMADGELVRKGEGGQAAGNFIFVKFSPEATGFDRYIYAKYQHLDELPDAEIGTQYKAGQQIAISGDTGTDGGYFVAGYPHLHLTTFASKESKIRGGGRYLMKHGRMIDPLAMYLDPESFSKIISKTTALDGTIVEPSVVLKEKRISKTNPPRFWPVHCSVD